jgi:hypothetical protein
MAGPAGWGCFADAYHRTLELLSMESTGTDYARRVIGPPDQLNEVPILAAFARRQLNAAAAHTHLPLARR